MATDNVPSLLQFQFYVPPPFSHLLKSETGVILAALSAQSCQVTKFLHLSSSFCPHCHHYPRHQGGSFKDRSGILNLSSCPQFCLSIQSSILQRESYFEDSNLICHSFAPKPKPRVLTVNAGNNFPPPQLPVLKLPLLVYSSHATPSCRSTKHQALSDSSGEWSPQPDCEVPAGDPVSPASHSLRRAHISMWSW